MSFLPGRATRVFNAIALPLAIAATGCAFESVDRPGETSRLQAYRTGSVPHCGNPVPIQTIASLDELVAAGLLQKLDRGALPADHTRLAWTHPTGGGNMAKNFGRILTPLEERNGGHEGVDLGGTEGVTKVQSIADGTVVYVLSGCPRGGPGSGSAQWCGDAWGNHVVVRHDGTSLYSRYVHLSSVTVAYGAKVRAGQELGVLGMTGLTDAPHLHMEVGLKKDGFKVCYRAQPFDAVVDPAKLPFGAAARGGDRPVPGATCRIRSAPTGSDANVRDPSGNVITTLPDGFGPLKVRGIVDDVKVSVEFTRGTTFGAHVGKPAFVHASQLGGCSL